MRAVTQADRGRAAADLLHRDDMLEVAEAGAAVFLLDGDAEQAEFTEPGPEITRELVGPVDLVGARRDLVGGEAGDRIADHVCGLAEPEIEHRRLVRNHRRTIGLAQIDG